ncbi:hypothetical protein GCM10010052_06480 [Paenarthrobacter histidinolovorans]|nr:hypothetical protein GCM10010052_06480 [Paenarthrobacter histidinolovorans]
MGEAYAEADAHGPRPLDLADEAPLVSCALKAKAGSEDQLPAAQEPLRVFQLGHGNPADVLVPRGLGKAGLAEFQGGDSDE